MKEYIPLLSVLLGGIIGFFASFITNWQSNKFNKESEKLSFQKKKREDLYYVVAKLRQEYSGYMSGCLLKVINQQPFKFEKSGDIHNWAELSMIVNLYFPQLKESVEGLLLERDKFGKILAETISFKSTSEKDMKNLNVKIMIGFKKIDEKFISFQEKISEVTY